MIFFRISEYLHYRWKAKNAHGVHSPFVFSFYNEVLRRKIRLPEIEKEVKKRYLTNREPIQFQDPKTGETKKTTVQSLAKRTWSGKSFSYFLIRLCEWLQAKTFLETGTALGIAFSMVSHTRGIKKVYSIEGSSELAEKARQLSFKPENVEAIIRQGNVKEIFSQVLADANSEVVFLDADHRSETIQFYLNELKNHKGDIKAIVIHDIYWSPDMKSAWQKVIDDPDYALTVDCFHAGIIFPKRDMEKQHFILKY